MRKLAIFGFAVLGLFIIDQGLKDLFESGYNWQSNCISLELHYNKGVAFSMFAALGSYLKWIQVLLVTLLGYFIIQEQWLKRYPLSVSLLAAGALGNIYDRFTKEGVVDFVYWHCGFDFAVFNFADTIIDLGIALILLQEYLRFKREKR